MTPPSNVLTGHFRSIGYLRVLDVLDRKTTAELRAFVAKQKAIEDARHPGGVNSKLYGLYDRNSDLIRPVVKAPALIETLEALLGPNIICVTNRHNHAAVNDTAGTAAEARLHRDILSSTRGLITAAFYLQDSTIDNGCTSVVPGSHLLLPYVGVSQPNGGGTWMDEHEVYAGMAEQAVPVPMPEGSVLLFDACLFHSVGNNLTDQTRMSLTFGYRAADELDLIPDTQRQLTVAGRHIYRGNDQ